MLIEMRTETTTFDAVSKLGKVFKKKSKPKLVIVLKCDGCGSEFVRSGHALAPHRRNNKHKHFCDSCKDPAVFMELGREKYNEAMSQRVGERQVDSCGYMTVYVRNTHPYSEGYCGRVREHILVMENHLKRALEKGEVVHHIDGDKLNNVIENLDLCTVQEHNACHGATEALVFELYRRGLVGYDRSTKRYFLKM